MKKFWAEVYVIFLWNSSHFNCIFCLMITITRMITTHRDCDRSSGKVKKVVAVFSKCQRIHLQSIEYIKHSLLYLISHLPTKWKFNLTSGLRSRQPVRACRLGFLSECFIYCWLCLTWLYLYCWQCLSWWNVFIVRHVLTRRTISSTLSYPQSLQLLGISRNRRSLSLTDLCKTETDYN